jgi:hypothetical protein
VALFFFKLYQVHKHFMTTVVKSYKLEEKFNYIIIMLRPPLIYRVEKPKEYELRRIGISCPTESSMRT